MARKCKTTISLKETVISIILLIISLLVMNGARTQWQYLLSVLIITMAAVFIIQGSKVKSKNEEDDSNEDK